MRSVLAVLLLAACATAAPVPTAKPEPLHFEEDDYAGALALAKARGLPLFVDTWAPWCHTCLSMKETVFRDPAMAAVADRFVFLSLDTEKESSAAFLARFPLNVWPTFFVIDPKEERAVLRWLGSATTAQMLALLDDGERAARGGAQGAEALLARADRLYGAGDARGAAAALEEALTRAAPDWPRRGRAAETWVMALGFGAKDWAACARAAESELAKLPRSSSWANVAGLGLTCALEGKDVPKETTAALEARVREALAPPDIEMAPDDRSGLWEELADARDAAGDEAGKRAVAGQWLAYLELAAARARTPAERAVYDSHRVNAAIEVGQPDRALAALQASERDFPRDYNPPARLALIYLKLGRLDDALAANDRALARVYGPRRTRVLNDRGDILRAKGDRDGARAAWASVEKLSLELPPAQIPVHDRERAARSIQALTP